MVDSELSSALDEVFLPFNRSDAPGLVVGVAHQGTVLYRRGFGLASMELSVANTPHTRMRIGSTSKHFTALLALLLAEDGKPELDAPIRRYIPELTGPGGDPTLRQLLQHSGGARCYTDVGFLTHGLAHSPNGAALAMQVRQRGRNFAPGETMIYNNGGYHLVSIAIERVGGAPFEEQLKQRLFEPLGMADTASVPSDLVITPGIAAMHMPTPAGGWRRGLFPSEEVRGEGAIVSTVDDMLRWAKHLRTKDRFGSATTWAALTELPTFPDGHVGYYSLGLMIQSYRGVRLVHHAGAVMGGSCQMLTVPEHELDVVIIVNGAPGCRPAKLAEQVVDLVLAEYLAERTPTIATADYRDLLGDWWSADTGMVYSLMDENDELKLAVCGLPGLSLERSSDGRSIASGMDLAIGELEVGLDAAIQGNGLRVQFGGQAADYRRLSKDAADVEAFAAEAIGQYYSADAGCTAIIVRDGEHIVIRFSDPYGQSESELICLGEVVALATFTDTGAPCTLSFSKQDGQMTGFRINSIRTRNLAFERRR